MNDLYEKCCELDYQLERTVINMIEDFLHKTYNVKDVCDLSENQIKEVQEYCMMLEDQQKELIVRGLHDVIAIWSFENEKGVLGTVLEN